ncbi:hypothetical protein OPIT5_12555 [Opitutaceae bacterium TAV5]|nr:hypothetical protein OPIT5_12555 [Opitutaceae bacterium TAV5]
MSAWSNIRIVGVKAYVLPLRARMPFRFGISCVTRVPHVIVRVEVAENGRRAAGVAADNLMPKWFTKSPDTTFREDVDELRESILSACEVARAAGEGGTVFALWHEVHGEQLRRGDARGWPHLLANFGASLIERALIDAACRLHGLTFHDALVRNFPGIRLEAIYPELEGTAPAEAVPSGPVSHMRVRHTIGLTDPLTREDLKAGDWPRDGLPVCLEDVIACHGIRRFKIKVSDDTGKNIDRLRAIAAVIDAAPGDGDAVFTLDGNESWRTPEAFEDFWCSAMKDTILKNWFRRLRFVEQPLHRDCALDGEGIRAMRERLRGAGPVPPVIIDESDADTDTLARALAAGYAGTTHKNCKGVFKSVANLALLHRRARRLASRGEGAGILSGEDLTNVGPVALLEDLCVAGALGIDDLERNGHHYFAGLGGFPPELREPAARHHADVFTSVVAGGAGSGEAPSHGDGLATVRIVAGRIECASLHRRPGLGPAELANPSALPSLENDADWAAVLGALAASPDED